MVYFAGILVRYLFLIWLARLLFRKVTGKNRAPIILTAVSGLLVYAGCSTVSANFNYDAESLGWFVATVIVVARDLVNRSQGRSISARDADSHVGGVGDIPPAPPPPAGDLGDVVLNFMAYIKDYLIYRIGLSDHQADILMCDPTFGREVDSAKHRWADLVSKRGEDPDTYLVGRQFDHPIMNSVNGILNKYGLSYNEREVAILRYLRGIGHPLGR